MAQLDDKLSYSIIGAYLSVYNQLPHLLKESLHHNAFIVALTQRKLGFQREIAYDVYYDGVRVGVYRPDVIVEGRILVELKSVERLTKSHIKQVRNYLQITGLQTGLLFNFGLEPEFKRVYPHPDRKSVV